MNKTRASILSVVVVLAVAIGGGLWWFFSGDTPAEVSLDAATASVTESTLPEVDGETSTTVLADESATEDIADDITGTWTIDTSTGEFDYESATGTFAGFRIEEELSSIGSTTAVGRTGDVAGSMSIDGTTVTDASFEIDLTTITTNESRRDDNVQSALDVDEFPTATFTLTEPIELGDRAASGAAVAVTAVGDLTLHGVTQPVEFALDAQLVNSTVVVVGSTEITFSDYEVEVPSSPIVLSVSDSGTLELQFLLTK